MRQIGAFAWLPILSAVALTPAVGQEPQPGSTDLLEQVESRLAQFELSVSGPPEVLARLTAADLTLKVSGERIHDFLLDVRCPPAAGDPSAEPSPAPTLRSPASYMLYFDQAHLKLAGRQRAIDLARQIVPLLVRDGHRMMILSDARELELVCELTSDASLLLAALERLEHDRTQWDIAAEQEEQRVGRVIQVLNEEQNVNRAVSLALTLQREESWRSEKSLRRLTISLGQLDALDPPRAVLYFADTMRRNAGEHYLSFFGSRVIETAPGLRDIGTGSQLASLPFDAVLDSAAARGIRFYSIRAEGLAVPTDALHLDSSGAARAQTVAYSSRSRDREARDSLNSLASETGGRAFVNGESARKLVEVIRQDLSCTVLLSFDPATFLEDAPLRLSVESRRGDLTVHVPGRVVVQSERARLRAKLLSAFALERGEQAPSSLQSLLVPTGFAEGRYSALLQIRIPPTSLAGASWDIGTTIVAGERVVEQVSGNLVVQRSGVPVVLEREVSFAPGPHALRSAAHETRTDLVLSDHGSLDWPDPDGRAATCGPIAVVQRAVGAFARGSETRVEGSLARGEHDAVDAGSPIVLIGLVCRGAHQRGALRVERTLAGSSEVGFPPLDLDLERERCAQVQDVVPQDLLAPGAYRYALRVLEGEALLDEAGREILVRRFEP